MITIKINKVIFILSLLFFSSSLFAKDNKTFTIALTGKYPPFSFYSNNGELTGFDVDVAKLVAKKLNRKLKIVTTEWDGILAGLLSGKYDAIIGSMSITGERSRKVNFSTPYYISGAQIFIHKDNNKVKDIIDLKNKKVGVGLGETFEHFLRKNYPGIETVTYKSTVDIYQDMNNNRIDAFLTDRLVGSYQIRHAGLPFKMAGPLLYEEKIAIPVLPGNTNLLKKINSALIELKNEGELNKLNQKWFGTSAENNIHRDEIKSRTIVKMLIKGFLVTILVAFLSLLIGILLAIPSGVILNSRTKFVYPIVRGINDFLRGTPVLIQLFFIYFGAPQIGITLSPVISAILTLSINSSAYMSEVVRSGLMSVNPGQKTAAKALGFTRLQTFTFIIWPQAFRIALPPLVNSAVSLLKDTALISVISVGEVIREAQSIISVTYNPMKYYLIVAAIFFLFTYPLMRFAVKVERRIKEKGFQS